MRSGYIIKNHLDKIGIEATLYDGEWNSMPFKCTVNPLWRKNAVKINDEVIYYTGILREIKEAEYDEY